MCTVGDIILIKSYKQDGHDISKHSFVVLSDEAGNIKGLDYDIICNVLSSFKDEEQRIKKLNYPGNFEISHNDTTIKNGNTKNGFIKAEQLFYFKKDNIDFIVIGKLDVLVFNRLLSFLEQTDIKIEHIIDNLECVT